MKKLLLIPLVFLGLGAMSSQTVDEVRIELAQRYWRDANNQILIGQSEAGFWYFQGKMDARLEDFMLISSSNNR